MGDNLVEHLLPERREVIVDDGGRDEAGIHHLEEVLVLELLIRLDDAYWRTSGLLQRSIQATEATEVARGPAYVHVAPGQVFGALGRRHALAGDDDFAHVAEQRRREVHQRLAFGGDGEVGGRDVSAPLDQRLQQPVATDRNECDRHHERAGLQPLVQERLERLACLVGGAALLGVVEEVIGAAEGDEHPDVPPLHHAVEIAFPRLEHRGNRFV